MELGRVLNPILGLAEDQSEHALLSSKFVEGQGVVGFELGAVLLQQRGPVVAHGNSRRLIERLLRSLVGHLEEQQIGQLLDIVAI